MDKKQLYYVIGGVAVIGISIGLYLYNKNKNVEGDVEMADLKTKSAVERQLIIIGEVINKIKKADDLELSHSKEIINFRITYCRFNSLFLPESKKVQLLNIKIDTTTVGIFSINLDLTNPNVSFQLKVIINYKYKIYLYIY